MIRVRVEVGGRVKTEGTGKGKRYDGGKGKRTCTYGCIDGRYTSMGK